MSLHFHLRHGRCLIIGETKLGPMIQPLVTYELVEFEKEPVIVQDFKKIVDDFKGIYRIYPYYYRRTER